MPSQQAALKKRDARMAELFFLEGLETTDIAEKLIDEGLLESKTLDSAKKTVRTRLKQLRDERRTEQGDVGDYGTAKDRHISRLLYATRKLIAYVENEKTLTKVVGVTRDGTPVTTEVDAVPIAEKNKALKTLAAISERLAVVTGVQIGTLNPKEKGGADEAPAPGNFEFRFSGKTVDSLIGERAAGKGAVN
jgi:hypothetical protein